MKNLVYDLPLDCQELIMKEKKLLENKQAIIDEMKQFNKLEWIETRKDNHKYPYIFSLGEPHDFLYKQQIDFYKHGKLGVCDVYWRTKPRFGAYNFNDPFWWKSLMLDDLMRKINYAELIIP
jgi:hypothetical protein